jgi:hypothetical protein
MGAIALMSRMEAAVTGSTFMVTYGLVAKILMARRFMAQASMFQAQRFVTMLLFMVTVDGHVDRDMLSHVVGNGHFIWDLDWYFDGVGYRLLYGVGDGLFDGIRHWLINMVGYGPIDGYLDWIGHMFDYRVGYFLLDWDVNGVGLIDWNLHGIRDELFDGVGHLLLHVDWVGLLYVVRDWLVYWDLHRYRNVLYNMIRFRYGYFDGIRYVFLHGHVVGLRYVHGVRFVDGYLDVYWYFLLDCYRVRDWHLLFHSNCFDVLVVVFFMAPKIVSSEVVSSEVVSPEVVSSSKTMNSSLLLLLVFRFLLLLCPSTKYCESTENS